METLINRRKKERDMKAQMFFDECDKLISINEIQGNHSK